MAAAENETRLIIIRRESPRDANLNNDRELETRRPRYIQAARNQGLTSRQARFCENRIRGE